jgi:hypothetical protein
MKRGQLTACSFVGDKNVMEKHPAPLPINRCWGIGLGRTGTTSLCEAFRILGFLNVIHNPPFEALASADAGADNGVILFYKYLDYKFPGSKFVLTLRTLDDWLQSQEYIFSIYPVRSRDEDIPIQRRMLLYETVEFDRAKFTAAYERHHRDVRRYFARRPDDLLELDIIGGEGWERLCPFLGLEIPNGPFPYVNRRNPSKLRLDAVVRPSNAGSQNPDHRLPITGGATDNLGGLPKVIWLLWLQGWDTAPEIVSACRRTWEAYNPGWTVVPLTKESADRMLVKSRLMSSVAGKNLPAETISDLIRVSLLLEYGGVWADATTYCLRKLDDWLPEKMVSGFFAFANPGPDRMISNWFLAAAMRNPLVSVLATKIEGYWRDRREYDAYFWFHYLFERCYAEEGIVRTIWDTTPKISADQPHSYYPQDEKLLMPVRPADRDLVEGAAVPLLKLSHKLPQVEPAANSVFRYLCARASGPTRAYEDRSIARELVASATGRG